jgi:hypothetical protein
VSYLSGGGAGNLPVKLRTLMQPKAIYFPDYEGFSFGGEDIHEGIEPIAGADRYFPEEGGTRPAQPRPAQVLPTRLDNVGAATQLDRLKLLQEAIPAYPVRVYQATLMQIEKPFSLPVQRPADAIPGRGGMRLSLRAKLGEDLLGGMIAYMARYPYRCLEQ